MMYSHSSLPKAYGASSGYGRAKGGGSGMISTVALVVLLVVSGGLSLALVSTRSQMRDTRLHHEALQEELTYAKNHLHHVESQLASKTAEYTHLQEEVNQYTAHHSIQELEALRNHKRVADQTMATTQEETKKLKEELDAAHALIDAYKHHLSDEVANHHAREETWLSVQQEWEKLEKEFQAEIDALRAQLTSAHIQPADAGHAQHHIPQHIAPEVAHHDPLLDSLPPAHAGTEQHQQQQHHYNDDAHHYDAHQQHHQQQQYHAAPTPVPTYDHHQQQHHDQAHHGGHAPAPVHANTPPHPAEVPHAHHDDHYQQQHHDAQQHHDWAATDTDYGKVFDHHNLYADYPGFVDETQDAGAGHHDQQQHHYDATQHQQQHHYDATHQQQQHHYDTHAATGAAAGGHDNHAAAGAHYDQYTAHHDGTVHADAGHTGEHHTTWQHHDDAHAFHAEDAAHHVDAHAGQHAGHGAHDAAHQQQQHDVAAAHQAHEQQQQQQQHHVVDDLAMKLGLGGHHEDPAAAAAAAQQQQYQQQQQHQQVHH